MNINTIPPSQCPHCAAIQQALLSFTGVIKNSNDPEIKKAANQLYKNVKRVKIREELKGE